MLNFPDYLHLACPVIAYIRGMPALRSWLPEPTPAEPGYLAGSRARPDLGAWSGYEGHLSVLIGARSGYASELLAFR
jgi:hypothetical protein